MLSKPFYSSISLCSLKTVGPKASSRAMSCDSTFQWYVSLWHVSSCPCEARVNDNSLWVELSEKSPPIFTPCSKIRQSGTEGSRPPRSSSTSQETWRRDETGQRSSLSLVSSRREITLNCNKLVFISPVTQCLGAFLKRAGLFLFGCVCCDIQRYPTVPVGNILGLDAVLAFGMPYKVNSSVGYTFLAC